MVHIMYALRGGGPTDTGVESTSSTVRARLAFVLAKRRDVSFSDGGLPMTVGASLIASPPSATTLAFFTFEALRFPLCVAASLSPRARFPAWSTHRLSVAKFSPAFTALPQQQHQTSFACRLPWRSRLEQGISG